MSAVLAKAPGYVVTVPALPGCVTQGATLEQAIERAREAIETDIAALVQTGTPVPPTATLAPRSTSR